MPVLEQCIDILSSTDREVIRLGGYGNRRGLGKQPALMIIDAQYNYAGDDKAILDQIKEWPSHTSMNYSFLWHHWNCSHREISMAGYLNGGGTSR